MGISDLSAMFEVLDPSCQGYLTPEDILDFHEALYYQRIAEDQVEGAIIHVCGADGGLKVFKEDFQDVILELGRRREVEQRCYWDFQALDRTGSNTVHLKDALLLLKETHGDKFSTHLWNTFIASRPDPAVDSVCWDEIRMFLCNQPVGAPSDYDEILSMETSIDNRKKQKDEEEYDKYKNLMRQDSSRVFEAREREDYENKVKKQAKRKQNKWEKDGLEAMFKDDGKDVGVDEVKKMQHHVGVNQILDVLEHKYNTIREKLFWDMLQNQEDGMWPSLHETERMEQFSQLQIQVKHLRKDGTLDKHSGRLPGALYSQEESLYAMMGEPVSVHLARKQELLQEQIELKTEGKSDEEIDRIVEQKYTLDMQGSKTCDKLLIDLEKRYRIDYDTLLSKIKSSDKLTRPQLVTEYCLLIRQLLTLEAESQFTTATVAVGLAERNQEVKSGRFEHDRRRQEKLASSRLSMKSQAGLNLDSHDKVRDLGIVDLQLEVAREVFSKYSNERQVLIQILKDCKSAKSNAHKMTSKEMDKTLIRLRSQRDSWRESVSEYKLAQKANHTKILQSGVGIYYERQRQEMTKQYPQCSEQAINASILADLQQIQDRKFEQIIRDMQNKSADELLVLRRTEQQERVEEYYDNLASLTLGSVDCTEEEKVYLSALDEKYSELRDKLLLHALSVHHGPRWRGLAEEEKQRQLIKKRQEEKRVRQDGKFEEMEVILGSVAKEIDLHSLVGDNRGEYMQRLKEQFSREEALLATGHKVSETEYEETVAVHSINPLADVQHRYFEEYEALVTLLRSPEMQQMSQREKEMLLVHLTLEKMVIARGGDFRVAAYGLGLMERVAVAPTGRHSKDISRQTELAKLRIELRREHVMMGRKVPKELDDHTTPVPGDLLAWEHSIVRELCKKHAEEWEVLLSILMDPGLDELRSVAETMSDDEIHTRLQELRNKRRWLDIEEPSNRDENTSILEEASAICSVRKKKVYGASSYDEVTVWLLTELQDEQDKETAVLLEKLAEKTEAELESCRQDHIDARHWGSADNVLAVVTRYLGEASDHDLLKALENKYDSLKDKLLAEALMKQLGEVNWNLLSEQERQRRILQLKLQEKRLRREGNMNEIARLLGDNAENAERLRQLFGDNRAEYERKLRERIARRQKRIEEGLDPDEDEEDSLPEEEDLTSGGDPLNDLNKRFEDERDALLAKLRGANNQFLSEKERQAELIRLRREKLLADRESKFEDAALLIGLAERQQAEANESYRRKLPGKRKRVLLKNDRARQEQLAKERLAAMREKRAKKMTQNLTVEDGDQNALMNAYARLLEEKHSHERQLLLQMLDDKSREDLRLQYATSTEDECHEKLEELNVERKKLELGSEHLYGTLRDAAIVKMEARRNKLSRDRQTSAVTDDDVTVTLMADLQEQQDKESALAVREMVEKSKEELKELQQQMIQDIQTQKVENVVCILFGTDEVKKLSNDDLVEALEGKYDALRDKLLVEALMKEYGELEWKRLSEQERQKKLFELKLKERQLRRDGRLEEAEALLGELMKDKETLDRIFGESKEEQERKLKERLEKRKKRREQGMTEEECSELEKKEIEEEEEEENRKRRNVLLDLQHRYDDEKDELLRRLQGLNDRHLTEKERQLELARLKREQRRARQEEKFDAAALVIAISKNNDQKLEDERLRQERLARERLEARRKKRAEGKGQEEEAPLEDVPLPEDEEDIVAMQDAVIKEMEHKHLEERDVLTKLLEEGSSGDGRELARSLGSEERLVKLEELKELRGQMRDEGVMDPTEQMDVFKEAVSVCIEVTSQQLLDDGKPHSDDDVQVALLADLQQHQDKESNYLLADIAAKIEESPQTLKQLIMVQSMARHQKWYDNVAATLLGSQLMAAQGEDLKDDEAEVVKALEQKYDTLRDKLLADALLKQLGEAEWNKLSEKERQAKLIKLKVQEKKLRLEGKYDEAAKLLGDLIDNEAEMKRRLGESQSEQKRQIEERLARRKQLMAERKAEGLTVDDKTLDDIIEVEESKKRKNILESLQHHFDDEKEALLRMLREQQDTMETEKRRQLELAKLKRDQKRLQKEEKFDAAAMLIQMSKDDDKRREENLAKDRDRQRELARQRLEARKLKRQKQQADNNAEQLQEKLKQELAEDCRNDMMDTTEKAVDSITDQIMSEVEQKHAGERDFLMSLLQAAEVNNRLKKQARSMNLTDLTEKLEDLRSDRLDWEDKMVIKSNNVKFDDMSEEEKNSYIEELAGERSEQFSKLETALVYRVEVELQFLKQKTPGATFDTLREEVAVNLLSDLQQKQNAENSAVSKVIPDKDEQMLESIRKVHRQARREGWMTNVSRTVFSTPERESEVVHTLDEDKLNADMDAQFEQEKQEFMKKMNTMIKKMKKDGKPTSSIDTEALLKELEEQQQARRAAMIEQKRKQYSKMKEKMEAKRLAKEQKMYEEHAAAAIVQLAKKNQEDMAEKSEQEKTRQGNMMAERLAARREARRRQAEKEKEAATRLSSASSNASLPPGLGLKREKTVVDVSMSDEQKYDLSARLVKQQQAAQKRLQEQLNSQSDRLQDKLEKKKGRRTSEAAALLSLGERQKTILQKSQQDEEERQRNLIKERVQRVRFERTKTVKLESDKKAKQFEELIDQDKSANLSQDDKMNLAAQRMMERFKQEENDVNSEKKKMVLFSISEAPGSAEDETDSVDAAAPISRPTTASRRLNDKDKLQILKERRLQRKRQKKQETNDQDDLV